jgi:subtilisin family serine protease
MQHAPRANAPRAVAVAAIAVIAAGSMVLVPAAASGRGSAPVDPRVTATIDAEGAAGFWVMLRERPDLSAARGIADRTERGAFVMRRLMSTAASAQRRVRAALDARHVRYHAFWAVNAVRVVRGDAATLEALAGIEDVAEVRPTWSASVDRLLAAPGGTASPSSSDTVEWNIARIRAPKVWKRLHDRGDGIVVANIDTGVQFDHPALVRQYRGNLGNGSFDHNYDWFDPKHVCPSPEPCDNVNHGTHLMGIVVGDDGDPGTNQIGVAPHARWITAKGCEDVSCSDEALVASGQWMLAPTNLNGRKPKPGLRPDVVSNGWGGAGGDDFYRQIVQDWVASGIYPVFSVGAGGPGCNSVGAPASYPESYGVGATDMNDLVTSFSGRGPSPFGGATKPNVVAPGISIRSSVPPDSYLSFSGTSMATSHAAGVVALVWSAKPGIRGDIAATRSAIGIGAIDHSDLRCGGTADNNNVYGEGRLDAFGAVKAALATRPGGSSESFATRVAGA